MVSVPNLEYCNNKMKGDVMQETEYMSEIFSINYCPQCFEDKEAFQVKDAMGISIGYTCEDCHDKLVSKYKPEIFKGNYESMALDHGERID